MLSRDWQGILSPGARFWQAGFFPILFHSWFKSFGFKDKTRSTAEMQSSKSLRSEPQSQMPASGSRARIAPQACRLKIFQNPGRIWRS
jgi:hypothetical protein